MSVKLYYFDARGLCEPTRIILSYGGIEFEDIRVPLEFPVLLPPEIKSKCRWGQVPLAEFEGKTLTQSLAVTRYFARKTGLVPADPYLAALCDEYVDSLQDSRAPFFAIARMDDGPEKDEKLKEAVANSKTKFWEKFEEILKSNGGKHLVGDSLTWADICLANLIDHFHHQMGVDLSEGYSNIRGLKETVFNIPKIMAWVEKRPKTKY